MIEFGPFFNSISKLLSVEEVEASEPEAVRKQKALLNRILFEEVSIADLISEGVTSGDILALMELDPYAEVRRRCGADEIYKTRVRKLTEAPVVRRHGFF